MYDVELYSIDVVIVEAATVQHLTSQLYNNLFPCHHLLFLCILFDCVSDNEVHSLFIVTNKGIAT